MSADVRPFRPEDEADLRRVMEASLAFDRFGGVAPLGPADRLMTG